MIENLRNIAIIAHVDHGKTTLVDQLLQQTGTLGERAATPDRVMDSNELERERGITIQSKSTAIDFEGVRIQLVDTPGHADFGGEVERVLGMVDAVLLLVDAVEGVMPQTRYVLRKALAHDLRPILVVNKIDRAEERAEEVVNEVFDLLVELGADDQQLDFSVVFASAKQGSATRSLDEPLTDLRPLLEAILELAPPPIVDVEAPLQFQAGTLGYDEYIGRLVIGRVERGRLVRGARLVRIPKSGPPQPFRLTKLFGSKGLERVELEVAEAGEIAVIAGIDTIDIGDTICEPDSPEPLDRIEVDPPTVRVRFSVNNSPFSGQEGKFVTSRQLGERLQREVLGNVSIRLEPSDYPDTFVVAGRGELLIAVLIETLRREGYEFSVSRPEIIQREIDGKKCEPVEDVVIEVPDPYAGVVMEKLGTRKGRTPSMEHREGHVRFLFTVPSRGLFGYRSEFLSDTRGDGSLYRTVSGYEPWAGDLSHRGVGAVVSTSPGKTTPYSLFHIQDRATLFIGAGVPIYKGQIIGETRRTKDVNVNAVRPKKLTNVRAAGKDEATVLTPPSPMTIESALEWLEEDELLEVTPQSLRLRKRILPANLRKRV